MLKINLFLSQVVKNNTLVSFNSFVIVYILFYNDIKDITIFIINKEGRYYANLTKSLEPN